MVAAVVLILVLARTGNADAHVYRARSDGRRDRLCDARSAEQAAPIAAEHQEQARKEAKPKPVERTEDLLKVDTIGLEIGYGLIPLVDANQGGDLLERISNIRKQLATELGIVVPPIRIRDNVRLKPNEYQIKIKGIRVAGFELMIDHLLAINPGYLVDDSSTASTPKSRRSVSTRPGSCRLFAKWPKPAVHGGRTDRRARDPSDRNHPHSGAGDPDPSGCPASGRHAQGRLPGAGRLRSFRKCCRSARCTRFCRPFWSERIPVRDLATIVETVSDYAAVTKETDVLAEYVRMALKRQITELYKDNNGKINVFTIDPAIEQKLADSVQNTKQGLMLVLDPALTDMLLRRMGEQSDRMQAAGLIPAVICSPNIRLALRRLVEASYPTLAVISYNEILPTVELVSIGMVRLSDDN